MIPSLKAPQRVGGIPPTSGRASRRARVPQSTTRAGSNANNGITLLLGPRLAEKDAAVNRPIARATEGSMPSGLRLYMPVLWVGTGRKWEAHDGRLTS